MELLGFDNLSINLWLILNRVHIGHVDIAAAGSSREMGELGSMKSSSTFTNTPDCTHQLVLTNISLDLSTMNAYVAVVVISREMDGLGSMKSWFHALLTVLWGPCLKMAGIGTLRWYPKPENEGLHLSYNRKEIQDAFMLSLSALPC